jgi:hypothetical protein
VLALERLHEVTRRTLVLESAVYSGADAPGTGGLRIGGLDRLAAPAFFLENAADATEAAFNWFLPTPECLELLLRTTGFRVDRRHALTPERSLFVCSRGVRHRARLDVAGLPAEAHAGEAVEATVRAWNVGSAVWKASAGRATEPGAVLLGVHLLDAAGGILEWDYRRFRMTLERDVAPLEAIEFRVSLAAPAEPGRYVLEFDLVREFEGWFEEGGSEPCAAPLEVAPPGSLR